MEAFDDIKIVGIDDKRPPKVRKEPYIDLFLKLSRRAPESWCEEFNNLSKRLEPPAKIASGEGLFIDAYVRDMDQIPAHLERIKRNVVACNEGYNERIRQRAIADNAAVTSLAVEAGEQGRLNAIIAALTFDT